MQYKDDKRIKKLCHRLFQNVDEKLNNLDSELASEYLLWIDKKTQYFKDSIEKAGYKTQPDNLKRGDVIWVEFGINVGTELSDFNTKGHYALVWAVDLGNLIVIPLSSRDATGSSLTFDLGVIEELSEDKNHSYLKLDAIRSISKRRIARMPGKEGGKISLNEELINKVKKAIEMALLN